MDMRKVAAVAVILLGSRLLLADASYQETTQVTGGTMVDSLKSVSFLSKSLSNMFAPTTTTTMVHGNQKAVVSKESMEITDLDRETMTHVDLVHKTYTVTTFAQMRQSIADMPKQMEQVQTKLKEAQPEQAQQPKTDLKTSFEVSAKNTGITREINGLTAQEQLVTMRMNITDPNAPADQVNSMSYQITTDAWIAPDPPEVKEIQDFDIRMGEKLMAGVDLGALRSQMSQNAGMAQLFAGKPGSAEAMAQMAKEMAKLKGTRVMEVTRMGGSGTGPAGAQNTAQAAPSGATTDNAAPATGGLGILGNALGGSALGAFRRKKTPAPTPADTTSTTSADGTQTTTSAVLMETTTQKANFSQAAVPASSFMAPAGFKRVEAPAYPAPERRN